MQSVVCGISCSLEDRNMRHFYSWKYCNAYSFDHHQLSVHALKNQIISWSVKSTPIWKKSVFWLFLLFDTRRCLITLLKPMSISEEMKLKAGILSPVVSGAFSRQETAPWWEKKISSSRFRNNWVRLSYSSRKKKTLEIFRSH